MRSARGWPVRRVTYVVATLSLVAGLMLLLSAFAREHRDLQRLYLLAFGCLCTGAGTLTALAVALGARGRRVLAFLGLAAVGAALIAVVALVWKVATGPEPLDLESIDDAPAGVPVPQPDEDAPGREP